MNRILISILLVAAFLSCTNNSYTLRGTAESAEWNGVVLELQVSGEDGLNTIGSVAVENQRFMIKGIVEEPTRAFLAYICPEAGQRRGRTFILENAKINFNLTEDMRIDVSGRSILQVFDQEMTGLVPRGLMDSLRNGLFLSEDEWRPRIEYYENKRPHLIADFVKKNVNTVAGTFVFVDNHRRLSSETKIEILDLMNETTKNNPQIQPIIQHIEAEQRASAGQPFIDFTLPTPAGEMLSLSDVVGNHDYVLLHFWASWCGPCIRIFPEMTRFYAENAGKSFEIFGVSLDDDEIRWKDAIENHGLVWNHVSDLKRWDCEVRQLYAVSGIPTRFLIDRNGNIVGRNMSFDEMAELLK